MRWVLLLLPAVLAGCGREEIQVYRVGKEQPQPAPQAQAADMSAMPPGHPGTSGGGLPRLKWTLPAGWQEAAAGEMRAASFRVQGKDGKQADVGVIPLPGMMGGDLENVNRWRSTVGLAPVKEEELSKLAQPVEVGSQAAQLYEQAGENPGSGDKTRILAAVLRREGVAWFFKMAGDDDLVSQQKPAFIEFLKGVSFPAVTAQAELPPSHPPIDGAGMMSASADAATTSSEAKPAWQVPSSWQEAASGPFLVAKFTVSGTDNAQAAINVSRSAGEGGGLAGNINRWRGQLGLDQVPEGDIAKLITPVDTTGGKAMFVDMTGTDGRAGQKTRLVGAIVSQAGQTWFYKLMGNEQVVAREKDAFAKFVQTAKYP